LRLIGWESSKSAVRGVIVRNRRSAIFSSIHRAAAFFESAWHNEGAAFSSNGEQVVLERLRPADLRLVVDAGANVGDWTSAALQLWPNCRVHAFEVAPRTFERLSAAFQASQLRPQVELHDVGLSDQPASQTMYYFPGHDELTCDILRHEDHAAVPFEAHLTTLDAFCAERGIEAIDYLKIDVEGAEHRVLKGARALLESDKINCIQFEYGAFSIQTRFLLNDYFDLLSDRFVIGKIFPDHVAFGDYDWTAEDFRFSNYLCVSKNRADLRQLLQG